MPLNKTCSVEAFHENIASEIRAGRPRAQAVAIAASTLRSACEEEGKPSPIPMAKSINSAIQSIIFDRNIFETITDVQAWLLNNNMAAQEIYQDESEFRAEIINSIEFSDNTFEVKDFADGIKMITGNISEVSSMRIQKAQSKKERSKEFLESALERAKKLINPRDYAVIFQAARASAGGMIAAKKRKEQKESSCIKKAIFVIGEKSPLEKARQDAFVGQYGEVFTKSYLGPLGVTRDECIFKFLDDSNAEELKLELSLNKALPLICVGKKARELLKSEGLEHVYVPHPCAVFNSGDGGEPFRKLIKLRKTIDLNVKIYENKNNCSVQSEKDASRVAEELSKSRQGDGKEVSVTKSFDEKQIVYGVVLDPYVVDLQGDWVPPAEIETTAHNFLGKSRVIGFEHMSKADAQIVESWVEPYPSKEDYNLALQNLPHKVYRRKFGDDYIHSGSWVAGVKLGLGEWDMFKRGELNAFSVGGVSFKTRVSRDSMPEIEIVEFVEQKV